MCAEIIRVPLVFTMIVESVNTNYLSRYPSSEDVVPMYAGGQIQSYPRVGSAPAASNQIDHPVPHRSSKKLALEWAASGTDTRMRFQKAPASFLSLANSPLQSCSSQEERVQILSMPCSRLCHFSDCLPSSNQIKCPQPLNLLKPPTFTI